MKSIIQDTKEIWADVKGYKGIYQVSNFGRVKSLIGWAGNRYKEKWVQEDRVLSPTDNGNGYLIVSLSKNRKRTSHYVHRLVATAFVNKAGGKTYVNHINYNTKDNRAINLEWCTQKENVLHSVHKMKKPKRKSKPSSTGYKYIYLRNNRYRLCVTSLGYDRTFKTIHEAIANRKALLGEEYEKYIAK